MSWAIFGADSLKAVDEITKSDSDRTIAIASAAILDIALQNTIKFRLRPPAGKEDDLFKIDAPLGNLKPKIQLAFRLYMFNEQIRDALFAITKIRNMFSHELSITFSHNTIEKHSHKLILHENKKFYPSAFSDEESSHPIEEDTSTNRGKYIVNLKFGLIHLLADFSKHQPWQNS